MMSPTGTERPRPRGEGVLRDLARRVAPRRACRSASAVTAQVLTMTASCSPTSPAARRITSLSNALSRQPKVMMSSAAIASAGDKGGIEAAVEDKARRPGHDDVAVVAPTYVELAAVEPDRRLPQAEPAAIGGDQRGAGAAAAGPGDAGAALPDPQPDAAGLPHRG